MTTHATTPFDSHQPHHPILYSNRIYARTKTTTTTTTKATSKSNLSSPNRISRSYLRTSSPINICENLLYDVVIHGDVGSATSSSYINSSDHYDNTYTNTYDNPIQYLENYPCKTVSTVKSSLGNFPRSDENFYDHAKGDDEDCTSQTSRSTSPVLFYLENRNLAICACIISVLILLLIGVGIFLLNKLIRPVIINTTVNNHYGLMNTSNVTTTVTMMTTSSSTIGTKTTATTTSSPLMFLLKQLTTDIITSTSRTSLKDTSTFLCPSDRWGKRCEHICKPCGLGVCHPTTGNCICPADIYGEFCDLWKVNDKPKRGDMMT